jgi:hypothetical protein
MQMPTHRFFGDFDKSLRPARFELTISALGGQGRRILGESSTIM